jgi:hypothetical protein
MSERGKNTATWVGILLTALAMAGGLALFASQSAAAREVRPVSERVTRLESLREEDSKKIDEMRGDIKELLRRVR